MIRTLAIAVLWGLSASAGAALAAPDPTVLGGSIDKAAPRKANDRDPALLVKAEILLDRAHVSPGEIDGLDGDNFRNAVRAFQEINGLPVTGNLDIATWGALTRDGTPVLKAYSITVADAAGPFTRAIPSNLEAMARLPGLSYTNAQAELAEKFHMSPTLLRELNPRADLARAGTELTVANVREMPLRSGRPSIEVVPPPNPPKVSNDPPEATIVVDKPARNLRVYDRDGKFLAFYPATIGSEEKPAPSGDFKVKGVSWNPKYQYDPKFAWKGVSLALLGGPWLLLTSVAAFGLGGYLAGSSRESWSAAPPDAVEFRDGIHGVLVWGLAILMGALLTLSASRMIAGRADLTAPTAVTAEPLLAFELDRLFRSDRSAAELGIDSEIRAQAARIITTAIGRKGMEQDDRDYLVRLVQARTGLPQPEAERRLDQVIGQAKDAIAKLGMGQ